jgi:predicted TIM-barrel fold metal-dependent hydrolase
LSVEETEDYMEMDDYSWVKKLKSWLSEDEWTRLLVRNPRKLYGYTRDD